MVTWSSSNEDIISSQTGVVARQDQAYQVRLTAVISKGSYSLYKKFVLTVLGMDGSQSIVAKAGV